MSTADYADLLDGVGRVWGSSRVRSPTKFRFFEFLIHIPWQQTACIEGAKDLKFDHQRIMIFGIPHSYSLKMDMHSLRKVPSSYTHKTKFFWITKKVGKYYLFLDKLLFFMLKVAQKHCGTLWGLTSCTTRQTGMAWRHKMQTVL